MEHFLQNYYFDKLSIPIRHFDKPSTICYVHNFSIGYFYKTVIPLYCVDLPVLYQHGVNVLELLKPMRDCHAVKFPPVVTRDEQ